MYSRPVRRVKVINLPGGEAVSILFDFEKLQKRCYTCQRLAHEQEKCLIFPGNKKKQRSSEDSVSTVLVAMTEPVLKKGDPLFGVLTEEQVGICPLTGRPRIVQVMLDGMRLFLQVAKGPETVIREAQVRISIEGFKHDLKGQKTILRQESAPCVSFDVDKGKVVSDDLREAMKKGLANSRKPVVEEIQSECDMVGDVSGFPCYSDSPTGYRTGLIEASSSGKSSRKGKPRRRPHMRKRKLIGPVKDDLALTMGKKEGGMSGMGGKGKQR
ncbi:unnamed protein product [Arabis nemorensis]|uniref:Zinc knuckle CX2CX4HX4C domain-containing protein n=1 Tax=Arabis nemorensis TaxID=586526 RepID=A0A565CGS7_9BRAS|nr:unnamed protein product [Arabis nemorensis]